MRTFTMQVNLPDNVSVEHFKNAMLNSGIDTEGIDCIYKIKDVKENVKSKTLRKKRNRSYDKVKD